MTTPEPALPPSVSIRVTASSDNENDEGYQHCFEQKKGVTLTFEVYTKSPVDSIHLSSGTCTIPPNRVWQNHLGIILARVGM